MKLKGGRPGRMGCGTPAVLSKLGQVPRHCPRNDQKERSDAALIGICCCHGAAPQAAVWQGQQGNRLCGILVKQGGWAVSHQQQCPNWCWFPGQCQRSKEVQYVKSLLILANPTGERAQVYVCMYNGKNYVTTYVPSPTISTQFIIVTDKAIFSFFMT